MDVEPRMMMKRTAVVLTVGTGCRAGVTGRKARDPSTCPLDSLSGFKSES